MSSAEPTNGCHGSTRRPWIRNRPHKSERCFRLTTTRSSSPMPSRASRASKRGPGLCLIRRAAPATRLPRWASTRGSSTPPVRTPILSPRSRHLGLRNQRRHPPMRAFSAVTSRGGPPREAPTRIRLRPGNTHACSGRPRRRQARRCRPALGHQPRFHHPARRLLPRLGRRPRLTHRQAQGMSPTPVAHRTCIGSDLRTHPSFPPTHLLRRLPGAPPCRAALLRSAPLESHRPKANRRALRTPPAAIARRTWIASSPRPLPRPLPGLRRPRLHRPHGRLGPPKARTPWCPLHQRDRARTRGSSRPSRPRRCPRHPSRLQSLRRPRGVAALPAPP